MSRIDQDESPFTTTADVQKSRFDRLWEKFDTGFLAPMRILTSDWRGMFGLVTVIIYLLAATVGVVVLPFPYSNEAPVGLLPPFVDWRYPLGTDGFARGMLKMTVHATPPMLKMITSGAVFATAMATIIGTLSAYKGGRTDMVLTTITDAVMTIPGLPLVIVIATILEPKSPFVVGIILTVNRWAGLARAIRSEVLTLRDVEYVEAARLMGIGTPTILRKDLIPNLMPYITVNFVGAARTVIFSSVALYFLGILPSSNMNWGVMMNLAYTNGGSLYTLKTAHWLVVPMVAIIWLSFGLILLAQAADQIFNVRLRARHAKTADSEAPPDA